MQTLVITGGTGYIGCRLIRSLDKELFRIIALVRPGSEYKIPPGIEIIVADVFGSDQWRTALPFESIFIHLLGVSHPSPAKKILFETIDLREVRIVADVAQFTKAKKFIFLSVVMESSSIMKDFQEAKSKGEQYIKSLLIPHVFIRPWYVLGPGHWWPYFLLPLFKLLELLPLTRQKAKAFGMISIKQMIGCLLFVVNNLDEVPDVIEIADIKKIDSGLKR